MPIYKVYGYFRVFWKGDLSINGSLFRSMGKIFEFDIVGTDRVKKSIEEITKEEIEGKTSLGLTVGVDISHCVLLARKHYKNFRKEVKYYRVCGKEEIFDPQCSMAIEFYG